MSSNRICWSEGPLFADVIVVLDEEPVIPESNINGYIRIPLFTHVIVVLGEEPVIPELNVNGCVSNIKSNGCELEGNWKEVAESAPVAVGDVLILGIVLSKIASSP